ncbi:MAG: bifunctional hydroxymethylpyrimidine kinase/phosphomethylpyrimidine kinase, partial [Candidatus Tumulicola sp.]
MGAGAVIVLSIGTSHPWNVAGTGRDVVVATRLGVRVFTAMAGVSAQDARGVRALHPVPVENLREQLAALPWDAAGAVRIGAMASAENVRAVASALRGRPELVAVVDPVSAASHGGRLADDDARREVAESLATLPNVVLTPNAGEAAALLGVHPLTRESIAGAAVALQQRWPRVSQITFDTETRSLTQQSASRAELHGQGHARPAPESPALVHFGFDCTFDPRDGRVVGMS